MQHPNVAKFPSYSDVLLMLFLGSLSIFYLIYKYILARDTLSFNYANPPSKTSLILKLLWKALTHKQGRLAQCLDDNYVLRIVAKNCRIDVENLQDYQKICGYKVNQTVPICFPEILFNGLLIPLISSTKFRLSPLGLIHIKQDIEVLSAVKVKQSLTLIAEVLEYKQTERGIEVEVSLEVHDEDDVCKWKSRMTLLSRNSQVKKKKPRTNQDNEADDVDDESVTTNVKVAGNTGLEYAKVSGDYNPHHLYKATAKLFGFRSPIAHGMWTLAMAINIIDNKGMSPRIGSSRVISAQFKTPLFMPSDVQVKMKYLKNNAAGSTFIVENLKGVPHLTGTYTCGNTGAN